RRPTRRCPRQPRRWPNQAATRRRRVDCRALPQCALMKPSQIEPFFAVLKAANPQPASELEFSNVFELLAAVLLSAQATDAGVNKATRRLFAVANTPARMAALGIEGITEHIKSIGLFRNKARNLHETSRLLIERHGGQVPRTREALEALPGVGRK